MNQDAIAEEAAPKKPPIPTHVSAMAYITKTGSIRYARSGKGLDLPKDFKKWQQLKK